MRYRRHIRTSWNEKEPVSELLAKIFLVVTIIFGMFAAPIFLWHLNDAFSKQLQYEKTGR